MSTAHILIFPAFVGGLLLCTLALRDLVAGTRSFWPPGRDGAGPDRRVFLWCFRLMVWPLMAASVLRALSHGVPLYGGIIGGGMMIAGWGIAVHATRQMRWNNAFGGDTGLVTTGWFARSRHPVYVASWLGMAGWALALEWGPVTAVMVLWATLYGIAIRLEEPWMAARFGAQWDAYTATTARYVVLNP